MSRWTDPTNTAALAATSGEPAYRPRRSWWWWLCLCSPAVPAAAGIRPHRHPRRARNPEARNRVGPARSCLFPSTPAKREGSPLRAHTPPAGRHLRRRLGSRQWTQPRTTDPTAPNASIIVFKSVSSHQFRRLDPSGRPNPSTARKAGLDVEPPTADPVPGERSSTHRTRTRGRQRAGLDHGQQA